jgi:23S rRNA (cytosine1962-C5)-methyltransferase
MEKAIHLKPGREKSLLRQHPWIFSGAISNVEGDPSIGETVLVLDSRGNFLARAAYSPHSQIRARVWTWAEAEQVDADFFNRRLAKAMATRNLLPELAGAGAVRLVHAESDGIPGFVADRYGDTLVVQLLSAGSDYWKDVLGEECLKLANVTRIYERSDVDVRRLEGLELRTGMMLGPDLGEAFHVRESQAGLDFWIDVRTGHKTGFYLDQRENRSRVRDLAGGRRVLDCFCYTGGFTNYALAGGAASVVSIDSSVDALDQAKENLLLNKLEPGKVKLVDGDVFQLLRLLRDMDQSYDLIVLDPPKFAQTAAQAQKAARGYKDINLLAFKLLRPGGLLVTFSCSGGVSEDLFQKIVAGAALDAGVEAQIIERLSQAPDHPVALNFPEGAYLKGLVIRV